MRPERGPVYRRAAYERPRRTASATTATAAAAPSTVQPSPPPTGAAASAEHERRRGERRRATSSRDGAPRATTTARSARIAPALVERPRRELAAQQQAGADERRAVVDARAPRTKSGIAYATPSSRSGHGSRSSTRAHERVAAAAAPPSAPIVAVSGASFGRASRTYANTPAYTAAESSARIRRDGSGVAPECRHLLEHGIERLAVRPTRRPARRPARSAARSDSRDSRHSRYASFASSSRACAHERDGGDLDHDEVEAARAQVEERAPPSARRGAASARARAPSAAASAAAGCRSPSARSSARCPSAAASRRCGRAAACPTPAGATMR